MNITKVETDEEAKTILSTWKHPYAVLDTETTSLDPFVATVVSYTVAVPSGEDVYFFPGHFLTTLKELKVPLVLQNFKYDFAVCYRNGVDLRINGLLHDTMLLDHLVNEENEHSLDAMVKRHFNDPYKEVFWGLRVRTVQKRMEVVTEYCEHCEDMDREWSCGCCKKELKLVDVQEEYKYEKIEDATEEELIEYSGKDAGYTAKIYLKLVFDVPIVLAEQVRQFALALYDTELRGIAVDLPYLNEKGVDLGSKLTLLESQFKESCLLDIETIELELYEKELDKRKTIKGKASVRRPRFNLASTAHICTLLYDKLRLPERKSKKGSRTVDDAALESLAEGHPAVQNLRLYRESYKVKTSFIDGTLEKMRGNRIYPSFNINGTVTGRISSSSPNMQQLPRDGGVRGIYIPDPGYVFLSYDYSQLEVTLAAHFSRDPNLLRIVSEGASQHDITAEGLGITRNLAKTVNFAMQYGAGVQKIQLVLGCTEVEAQRAYDNYWLTYKGLHQFIQECHRKIEVGEPLASPFGRVRHLPSKPQIDEEHGDSGFYSKRDKAFVYWRDIYWRGVLRQGPNSLIQGTGADCRGSSGE